MLGWGLLILILGGCGRSPYDALKPHQAIQAGDDAFRRGDLAEAEKIYVLARKKAERAELDQYTIKREYVGRLAQIYALQGKLKEVEPLYRANDRRIGTESFPGTGTGSRMGCGPPTTSPCSTTARGARPRRSACGPRWAPTGSPTLCRRG